MGLWSLAPGRWMLGHERGPAERRHGVLAGRSRTRRTVRSPVPPGSRVSGAVGVQVPVLLARAGGGPLLVAAPAVLAHHEDLDGRRGLERGLVALERGVEPAEVPVGQVAPVVQEIARTSRGRSPGRRRCCGSPRGSRGRRAGAAGACPACFGATSFMASYCRIVSPIKQSYQPPMWKVGTSTSVVPAVYVEVLPARVVHPAPEVVPDERDDTVRVRAGPRAAARRSRRRRGCRL